MVKVKASEFRTGSKGKQVAQGMDILKFHNVITDWYFNNQTLKWGITTGEGDLEIMSLEHADGFIEGALTLYRLIRKGAVTVR